MLKSLLQDNMNLNDLIENSYMIYQKKLTLSEKLSSTRSHVDLNLNNSSIIEFEKQINPKFLMPSVGYEMNTNYNVNINLSLPDNELHEYISHLKSTLVKNYSTVSLKKLFNGKNPTYKYVIGDILYIYDAVKIGMLYREITDSINSYRESVGILSQISESTIKNKYLKYAKLFIEEQNYYSLIDCSFPFDIDSFNKIKNRKS